MWGVSSDAGDGWDYGGAWRHMGRDKVSVWFPDPEEPRRVICSFWIDDARKVMTLSDCEGSDWNHVWHRDTSMERANGF